jgi:hypothetical protein
MQAAAGADAKHEAFDVCGMLTASANLEDVVWTFAFIGKFCRAVAQVPSSQPPVVSGST